MHNKALLMWFQAREVAETIEKCMEIKDYQKRLIFIQKVDYFGLTHIVSQSSLIVEAITSSFSHWKNYF